MKAKLHPKYNDTAKVVCSSCGASYDFGSTLDSINLAICAKCHPFYTGEQQVVIDTSNKISSFKERASKAEELKKKMAEIKKRREEREKSKVGVISSNSASKMTLKDLLNKTKSGK